MAPLLTFIRRWHVQESSHDHPTPDLKKLRGMRDFLREWESKGWLRLYEGPALDMANTIDEAIDAYEASARDAIANEVDAMRYRYIRESEAEFVHYIGGGIHGLYDGIELDQRVSAAITEEAARHATQGD